MRLCLIPLCIGLFSINACAMPVSDGSTMYVRSGLLASQPPGHVGDIAKQDPSRKPTDRNNPTDQLSAQKPPPRDAPVTITFEEVHEEVPTQGERNITLENFVVSLLQRQHYTTATLNNQTHIQWEHNVRSDWSLAQLFFRVEDRRTEEYCHNFCDATLDVHRSMRNGQAIGEIATPNAEWTDYWISQHGGHRGS
ncbi:hypothetical protein EV368DRAFT_60536 [Lentinula lateritia]|uniref:Uncharacterized protein n=1 Tax=Lentinula aff. lateritia TaxID=2804960 RepID=A0ACC1UGG8_9AGAR|nr:hypothetical protein F5876DRAFT_61061 [Lentinula aff. lateritia]KAJ3857775.1 hypothetical protein EV368DRAFT_60536 [Lentinula lateritia]